MTQSQPTPKTLIDMWSPFYDKFVASLTSGEASRKLDNASIVDTSVRLGKLDTTVAMLKKMPDRDTTASSMAALLITQMMLEYKVIHGSV